MIVYVNCDEVILALQFIYNSRNIY